MYIIHVSLVFFTCIYCWSWLTAISVPAGYPVWGDASGRAWYWPLHQKGHPCSVWNWHPQAANGSTETTGNNPVISSNNTNAAIDTLVFQMIITIIPITEHFFAVLFFTQLHKWIITYSIFILPKHNWFLKYWVMSMWPAILKLPHVLNAHWQL